jgi:alpha-tubulin suppressor-like RCC1 family protein
MERYESGTRRAGWRKSTPILAAMAVSLVVAVLASAASVTLAAPTISSGGFATVATTGSMVSPISGEVTSWGRNELGQLGNGTLEDSDAPGSVTGLAQVTAIAAGEEHSLALLGNGTVVAWGSNFEGALGDGTTSGPETCERFAGGRGPCSKTPIPVAGLKEATAISAGLADSLALLANGTVMAWGADEHGQLGDGSTEDPRVPVEVAGLTEVVAISAGQGDSLALLANGTVMAWGSNNAGQLGDGATTGPEACGEEGEGLPCSKLPVRVEGLSEVVAISAGAECNLALLKNGTVVAWGGDDLGNGTLAGSDVPVPVSDLSEVVAISAGAESNLALLKNGTVMSWGGNYFGLLGDGSTEGSDVPVEVSGLSGVIAISVGSSSALALESNGTVKAWGSDEYGQLGDGESGYKNSSNVPIVVSGLAGVGAIAAGGQRNLALGGTLSIPSVSAVEPDTGTPAGGTSVTIVGNDLAEATEVKFGSAEATSFEVQSEHEIKAVSPPGAGIVDVTVTTPEGVSPTHLADEFSYSGPPVVAELEPSHGECDGREGTLVTIKGSNFNDVTSVMFGTELAREVTVRDGEVITAVAPAAAGVVPVTVTTHFGTSTLTPADLFTYTGAAMVTEVEPDQGPEAGGTQVVIKGTDLSVEPIEGIAFGSNAFAYTFQMSPEDELTTVSPPGTGTVPVSTFGRACSSTTTAHFTYIPNPAATKVEPDHRSPADTATTTSVTGSVAAIGVMSLLRSALAAPLSSQLTPTIPVLLRHDELSTTLTAPTAGTMDIDWSGVASMVEPQTADLARRAPSRLVLIASGQHRFSAAGTAKIEIKLTAAGRRLLSRVRQVKLTATATFTPTDSAAVSATKAFSLKRTRRSR